jgi:hypothetical protein
MEYHPTREEKLMPTYTVEIVATDRRVYEVKDAQTDKQAENIARARFEAEAPIDLVEEEHKVTKVTVIGGQNDNVKD